MTLSSIFKFNPYHDKAGRFARADGAASLSFGKWKVSPEKKAQITQEHEKRLADKKASMGQQEVSEYSQEEANALAARLLPDAYDRFVNLPAGQRAAVRGYTGGDYSVLNSIAALTKGELDESRAADVEKWYTDKGGVLDHNSGYGVKFIKKAKDMTKALEGQETAEDMVVYRAANLARFGITPQNSSEWNYATGHSGEYPKKNRGDLSQLEGVRFQDHAFGSSSVSLNEAAGFLQEHRVLMEVKVPKGTKGMYVGHKDMSKHASELEFIVQRGSHYRLGKARQVKVAGGQEFTVIEAWLEGQEDHTPKKKTKKFEHVFKFNPYHDKAGRFAPKEGATFVSTGGRFSAQNAKDRTAYEEKKNPSKSAVKYAKEFNDYTLTPEKILKRLSPEVREQIKAFESDLQKRLPTEADVSYRDTAGWNDERRALHQKIIDEYTNPERLAAARPAAGEAPTLIMLGGRGGSGKSKFVDGTLGEFDASKFIEMDPDAIKQRLRPPYEGWNAAQVHEESKDVYRAIAQKLKGEGVNVIHNVTMGDMTNCGRMIKSHKDTGYRVEGHYMFLSIQEAATRAAKRAVGKDPRYVPLDVLTGNRENESVFDSLKPHFSKWSFYSNHVPMGQKPVKIYGG